MYYVDYTYEVMFYNVQHLEIHIPILHDKGFVNTNQWLNVNCI